MFTYLYIKQVRFFLVAVLGQIWWGIWSMFNVFVPTHIYIHIFHNMSCIRAYIHIHTNICTHICVAMQPVLLLRHLAFWLGLMRICLDRGSLDAWRWSLLSLQLDSFVVIFSTLMISSAWEKRTPHPCKPHSLPDLTRKPRSVPEPPTTPLSAPGLFRRPLALWKRPSLCSRHVCYKHTDANHSSRKRRILWF